MRRPNRRTVILQRARGLAARNGFAGMTTAALAKSMNVTEPVIYQHFDSKTHLLETLVEDIMGEVTREFDKAAAGMVDPLESLRAITRAYPAVARKFESEFLIINRALTAPVSRKMRRLLGKHYEQYADYLAKFVAAAQAQQKIRSDIPPRAVAWHLIHAALGFLILQSYVAPGSPSARHEIELASMVLEGVVIRGRT